ncbi:MAG TPA: NAD(P)/FAD-dependent oxidoreductase [Nocardioides sp.]|nr:NAD(P)/FAD-dependent oxidoreductase [Nocardioides sp.]
MTAHEVDLVVIGTGPGGEALANGAASAGLEVVVVEKHLVGGECPYYGCVPTKMMVRGSDAIAEVRRSPQVAGEATVTPAWSVVARRVDEDATTGWDDTIAVERLQKAGATVVHGVGRLAGTGRVVVETAAGETLEYTTRRGVVVNPGTRPAVPPVDGLADTPYWTNRDAVRVTELPGSLVVVGGGPIGVEMAQVFARFGVRVTVLQQGPRLVPVDEPEASDLLEKVFVAEGIRVLTEAQLTKAVYADGAFALDLDTGEQLTADKVLVAAGRIPNLADLGLETVGLDPQARTIEVDEWLRAGDGLWAIGDVTGHGAFTHVSMYQQAVALRDILGQGGEPARYHAVPHTTFTDPEIGGVGMTEQRARDAGLRVRTGTTDLASSSRGFTHGPGGRGLIKVVEDADRGVLVGATAMGPAGGEILGFLAVAVHAEVPVATLRSMIYAYPTFHRAIESALADLS